MVTQAELFQKHFPAIQDVEASSAIQANGPVVSMAGRRGVPDFFIVKFATEAGSFPVMALNRTVATTLRQLLEQSGF